MNLKKMTHGFGLCLLLVIIFATIYFYPKSGEEFVGKWIEIKHGQSRLEIKKDGDHFIVVNNLIVNIYGGITVPDSASYLCVLEKGILSTSPPYPMTFSIDKSSSLLLFNNGWDIKKYRKIKDK